ncbi:hypothetical protein ACVMHW_008677 [Bradyrhizobium diazoefficiens]
MTNATQRGCPAELRAYAELYEEYGNAEAGVNAPLQIALAKVQRQLPQTRVKCVEI